MTDFVWVWSLSKVALFFLSGIKKMNWSGITHSDSQKRGFLPSVRAPTRLLVKKNQFLDPMRNSYLFKECLKPTYFRRGFFPSSGVFLSVVRLGVLVKPRILRRNDEKVSKLR